MIPMTRPAGRGELEVESPLEPTTDVVLGASSALPGTR